MVNAVSAKTGGAKTIVESFVNFACEQTHLDFIIFAGFQKPASLPKHIHWVYKPMSGAAAIFFNLLGSKFAFRGCKATKLLSFNNINCILLPAESRLTYLHQLKALDSAFSEPKVRVIRFYLRISREPLILQSASVKAAFERMFGETRRDLIVSWPGITPPEKKQDIQREPRRVIVPVSSPQSQHKNFAFIEDVARALGSSWRVIVSAPDGLVDLRPGTTTIEFVGTLSRSRLFEEYCRATVCLVGSTHETVGLPIFEALSAGTPVVAFDAPYVREFRDHFEISKGLTLAGTPSEGASAIEAIASDPCSNISAARDFCRAEWDKVLNRI